MNNEEKDKEKEQEQELVREERMNPLNDYLFMKYMGEKGDEEQLISLLNAILQKTGMTEIVWVEIREDKTYTAEFVGDKSGVLDVRAKLADGTMVNIEVQVRDVSNMDRRSLFYWSREYFKGIRSGQPYEELPNVVAINILGQEYLTIDEIHASFHLWEDVHKDFRLTDALELHFIDMVKFRRLKNKDIYNNVLHRWLTFFDKTADEATIKKILEMDQAIRKAQKVISTVRSDREMFRTYQMRELALADFNSSVYSADKRGEKRGIVIGKQEGIVIGKQEGIVIGKQEGIVIGKQEGIVIGKQEGIVIGKQEGRQEGRQEGKQEAQQEHVLKLSQKGLSAVEISEWMDLPVEEINKILKKQLT